MDRNTILGIPRRKKISNNTVIEIAGCSPLEILKLQNNPKKIADGEGIGFIYGDYFAPRDPGLSFAQTH